MQLEEPNLRINQEIQDEEKSLEDQLDDDSRSVSELELEVRKELEPKILKLEASPEEVMKWWKSRDPLAEAAEFAELAAKNNLKYEKGSPISPYKMRQKECRVNIHSALILLTNIIDPSITTNSEGGWKKRAMQALGVRRSYYIDYDVCNITKVVVTKLEEKFANGGFSVDDFKQLLIITEMARHGLQIGDFKIDRRLYFESVFSIYSTALKVPVACIVLDEETIDSHDKEQLDGIDEIRMIGLQACMLQNAHFENLRFPDPDSGNLKKLYNKEKTIEALVNLIEDFRLLFNDPKNKFNTLWKRLREPHIKGTLHEALWYLDVIMLKHMFPEKYGAIHLTPSPEYADRPEIGKPEYNRAYDFFIDYYNPNNNQFINDFIQLKASTNQEKKFGNKKKYHPSIVVESEENFKDVEPRRLGAKLSAYSKIINNGFKPEDIVILEKYLLPTAKKYLEEFSKKIK